MVEKGSVTVLLALLGLSLLTNRRVKCAAGSSIPVEGLSQNDLDALADKLDIKVKVVTNIIPSAPNHVVKLTLGNHGNEDIPKQGWKMYFYSMFLLFPGVFPGFHHNDLDTEHVRINMVQGDLYSLAPIAGFQPISPGKSVEFNISASLWSVARTDFMPRWYVTSDDVKIKPRIVMCTASEDLDFVQPFEDLLQRKRWKGDQYEPFTPEVRMKKLGFSPENVVPKFVIPTPKSLQINEDRPTTSFNKNTWKVYTSNRLFLEMTQYIKDELGVNITDSITPTYANVIVLSYANEFEKEGYALDVKNNIITLTSKDAAGMFYAVQTLSSVISGTKGRIPELRVVDAPRFRWRGMQIDVARNFHSVVDIKRLIKAMSMYKMNVLHLHLTDDEGWRLVIDGLPELTQVGGRRCHDLSETECLIPQFGSGPFPDDSGSGFYNAAEYKELLSYAQKHHVVVVPEFDMPGHSHAAVASMESRFRKLNATGNYTAASQFRLKDTRDSSFYASVQNWMDDAINPCIESTYRFIGKVMDSVKALHADIQPLEIYHFGGDEVAHGAWATSDACSRFLRDNPPYRVTHGLKNYFVSRLAKMASERGLKLAGWEDGFWDGYDPLPVEDLNRQGEVYVNPWNNIWEWGSGSNAYKYANAGYKVILSQATNLYFDHPQEPDPEERGLYWAARYTDTRNVFDFRPDRLYDNIRVDRSGFRMAKKDICGYDMSGCTALEKPENIIGMQGALWSETVRTSDELDYMIFPRLVALAERAWHKAAFEEATNVTSDDEWKSFARAVGEREFARLEKIGVKYRIPPPGGRVLPTGQIEVSTTYPQLGVQYSADDGVTWQNIVPNSASHITWNNGDVLLRATNAGGTRFSRAVKLSRVPDVIPSV